MVTVIRNFTNYIFILIQFITITALAIDNKMNNVGEVVFVTILFIGYIFLGEKYSFNISNYTHICLALVVIAHSLGGKYLNLYFRLANFDSYLHMFGAYAVVLFLYAVTRNIMGISFASKTSRFLYITLLGIGSGAIFELLEFIVDITMKPSVHNQEGLIDINLDMISDLIGSLIAALHISFTELKSNPVEIKKR
ncbi:MAG: hypothetical protein JL50_09645 [Peptococcaceae bacterium BICA1-7]|nr:MAG: hypothetical protein JL50_09645 [Peptococcaceae bacterium BICA1-7]HBV95545.1 hypothetical protein [Desulfotomaculum sp.]